MRAGSVMGSRLVTPRLGWMGSRVRLCRALAAERSVMALDRQRNPVLAVCPECGAAEPAYEVGNRCLWCADENTSWYVPATAEEAAVLVLELAERS